MYMHVAILQNYYQYTPCSSAYIWRESSHSFGSKEADLEANVFVLIFKICTRD